MVTGGGGCGAVGSGSKSYQRKQTVVTATLQASLIPLAHLPASPLLCFSLGAWQLPSRWRVYFCFCLFTYSCIQLFGASQGLSFHHRMQIATAANPLSSLPCRHPTSLHVSPSLLQSGLLCFFQSAGSGMQWPSQLATALVSTSCMSNTIQLTPPTHRSQHLPASLHTSSSFPASWPWRHTGLKARGKWCLHCRSPWSGGLWVHS